jgi:hypothetical protein
MRFIIALAALALAACGPAPEKAAPAPAQGAAQGQAKTEGPVLLGTTQYMPDWLLIARTPDGGFIHFNQRAISRGADGTADIWVQVTYGGNQLYEYETETAKTTIRYTVERVHYRFRCADQTFVVVERQIMGPGERVVAHDEPRQIWRITPTHGAARLVMPIACRGS